MPTEILHPEDFKNMLIKAQQNALMDKLTSYYKELIDNDIFDDFCSEAKVVVDEIKGVKAKLDHAKEAQEAGRAAAAAGYIYAARADEAVKRPRVDSGTSDLEDVPCALTEFIVSGPMIAKLGLSPEAVKSNLAAWLDHATVLCQHLNIDVDDMSPSQRRRVYHYYLPVFFWCKKQYDERPSGQQGPLVVGISAPQGCGKTTIVESLEILFKHCNLTPASVSIDDFYLPASEQSKLAKDNPTNPLLQYRGNAGSHDLALGMKTINALKSLKTDKSECLIPRYDKSLNKGYGDRAPEMTWPKKRGPVDVVLFEGWMLGFKALADNAAAAAIHPGLWEVNESLKQYNETWDKFCDAWLVVKVGDYNWVQEWRLQAEVAMRAKGLPGMTDQQVRDFVNRYLPAYQAFLPGLYTSGPSTADSSHPMLVIEVDKKRNVIKAA